MTPQLTIEWTLGLTLIRTQDAGSGFIAEMRSWLRHPITGLIQHCTPDPGHDTWFLWRLWHVARVSEETVTSVLKIYFPQWKL